MIFRGNFSKSKRPLPNRQKDNTAQCAKYYCNYIKVIGKKCYDDDISIEGSKMNLKSRSGPRYDRRLP